MALFCMVLSMPLKGMQTQEGQLHNRNQTKSKLHPQNQRQEKRMEGTRDAVVTRILGSYGLKNHEKKIRTIEDLKNLKKRNYDNSTDQEIESFVCFYACKYCFDLTIKYYNAGYVYSS